MSDLRLNAFARVFADALFGRHPEWRGFAKTYGEREDCLVVTVQALVSAQDASPLLIRADGEVTVSFDCFHCHFDWPTPLDEVDHNRNAISFIDALLSETIGVVSWWRGDKLSVSTTFSPGVPDGIKAPPGATRMRRRSWRGTLNADAPL